MKHRAEIHIPTFIASPAGATITGLSIGRAAKVATGADFYFIAFLGTS
jgi:hypothetical protein